MNQNINLSDWHRCLQDAMWWENLDPDRAILVFKNVQRAHVDGLTYHVNDPVGGNVDLTKIYKQCKLLATLKAKHK